MATSVLRDITVEETPAWTRRPLTALVPPAAPAEGMRRALNIVVAVIGLVLTLPLMLVIAALIRLTSRGPIFYSQTRVGLDRRLSPLPGPGRDLGGRPFTIYKFRTMNVQPAGLEVWARPGDSRVTPLGRVLRRYRLDELPQLWNVLRGDMNVVGPRPEQPAIFRRLKESIAGYRWRQRVRPGITGLAQVQLPPDLSESDVRRKLTLDLEYIKRTNAVEDLRIMWSTPGVMLGRHLGW